MQGQPVQPVNGTVAATGLWSGRLGLRHMRRVDAASLAAGHADIARWIADVGLIERASDVDFDIAGYAHEWHVAVHVAPPQPTAVGLFLDFRHDAGEKSSVHQNNIHGLIFMLFNPPTPQSFPLHKKVMLVIYHLDTKQYIV